MNRKSILAATALFVLAGPAAMAEDFPSRPIRVIVPYAPGGGTDNLIRLLAAEVTQTIGQRLVIENKPGGATQLGVTATLEARADGYTILAQAETDVLGPLIKDRNYDPLKSFTAVVTEATAPILLTVHSSVPAKTVKELVELAKSKPGSLNYASGEATSTTRIAGEVFGIETGAQLTNVPYKGTGNSVVDTVSGYVTVSFGGISTMQQYVGNGSLRALALTGPKRNPAMPDVPTFIEAGYPGMDVEAVWMVLARKETPPEALKKLNEHFVMALKNPQVLANMDKLGFIPAANTSEQANALINKARSKMIYVIEKANLKEND